jgi:dUTP pyrophosphatase
MPLLVKKLHENAVVPSRGSEGAAGYDLSALHDTVVLACDRVAVPTGISMKLPEGTYGQIASRSGLAKKHGLGVLTGTVDEDYRGELHVMLFNTSDRDYVVKAGDRIAQLILVKIATPEVAIVIELDDTSRGAGGFGSTGK